MDSLNKTARIIGVLYLVITVLAPFGLLYVPANLIAPGDATATANNVMASEQLFRLSIVSASVVFLLEIVITALLYDLLKPVNQTLSLVAAFSRLAMTVVQGINPLNHFIALLLLSGAGYLKAFEPGQLRALGLLFLNAHEYVTLVWGLFFGFHLLVLGYLVYKSGYIPRILGGLLVVVSLCYLTQSYGTILFPQYKGTFDILGFLAIIEIAFPLWLLIKGVKDQKPPVIADKQTK